MKTMMKCGCAANGTCSRQDGKIFNPPIPCCTIHDCTDVAEGDLDLAGRTARCTYFGSKPHKNECDKCRDRARCACERPSSTDLAFFSHRPEQPFDTFYCGCFGWD